MPDASKVNIPTPAAKIAEDHWQEIKLLQDIVTKLWSIYFQWYQWYLALTLVAIYFVVNSKVKGVPLYVFGSFWIFATLSSISISIHLIKYIKTVIQQIDRLIELSERRMFGTSADILLAYGAVDWIRGNGVVLSFAAIGWAYIMIWQPY